MIKIKNILCDVLDYAYPDSDKLGEYKRFYVEMINETRKGFHGDYHGMTHHIRIYNLYRDEASIVVTTLHELAHHVDHVNRGKLDHGKEFYAVYKQLLHTALNMHLFDKEQFINATRDASDSNKVAKMINDYIPEDVSYIHGMESTRLGKKKHPKTIWKKKRNSWKAKRLSTI